MSAVPTLGVVALDCPDPVALAGFYRAVLEWDAPEVAEDGHWVTLANPLGGAGIAFQRVPDHRPPSWPSAENPQQLHLDLNVTDLEAAHERVLGLGAKLLDDAPKTFRVYADPAGHPFCLCAC
ncbi:MULTISPECIES: VOC family protein [Amycolatopsis]|uniref:VOC family protein n=1 Tax=Amycolatopsis eburnea TaxID=2267691 RepID=A0A3R9FUW5_9PSEU|nr:MULTISPECIES: VOC family protein [Amycolatopsis]NBH07533.1 VOC family protein [Amycolatopsis sp. SID8362]NED44229.1 VOC family protein [Amycolatopsis sp. SID8362]RSD25640.1 VOC family protein [Amycolatopsis eburnea]